MRALRRALLSVVVVAAAAPSAAAKAPTLHASRTLVEYGRAVSLSGSAPADVTVVLEANRFPFKAGYVRVSATVADPSGSYTLAARPSRATRYRVFIRRSGQPLRSPAISVYVEDLVLRLSCNLCSGNDSPGAHTLRVDYSSEAPPGRVAVTGPVYLYYGLVGGSDPPQAVRLVKKIPLRRRGRTLSYSVAYQVDFPSTAFQFRVLACFEYNESKDGVGLPGHHHCGASTLSRRQYLGYLG